MNTVTYEDLWRIRMVINDVVLYSTNYTAWFSDHGVWAAFNRLEQSRVGQYVTSIERYYTDDTWKIV